MPWEEVRSISGKIEDVKRGCKLWESASGSIKEGWPHEREQGGCRFPPQLVADALPYCPLVVRESWPASQELCKPRPRITGCRALPNLFFCHLSQC